MAFQATAQEGRNRKILEQLEEEKKRLRMQAHGGGPSSLNSNVSNSASLPVSPAAPPNSMPVPPTSTSMLVTETHTMTPQQRAALQHAHANSVGYFITQDSSFGNVILPVLPRFIEK